MRKFLLICSAMLLPTAMAFSYPTSSVTKRLFKKCSPAKRPPHDQRGLQRIDDPASGMWYAQNQKMYVWTGVWTLAETNDLTFNESGKILTQLTTEYLDDEIDGYTRTTNTYDSHGMVTERMIEASLDGENFTPFNLRVVAYDPIVTNLIISNEQTMWSDGNEYPGNCYHFNITRNAEGNITLAERAVLFNGEYDPTEQFNVQYGADNRAISTSQSMLQYDYNSGEYYWEETGRFDDIVWEETDGQIYDEDSMMMGNNKLKSATMYDAEADIAMQLEASYSSDGFELVMTSDLAPGFIARSSTTYLPNGGYTLIVTEEFNGSVFLTIEETIEYAANGLILREYLREEALGEEPFVEETLGEFFGGTDDKPESYEYSIYDPDEKAWIPSMRVEFSDYIYIASEPNAIEDIASSDHPTEYYNLQGIRIEKPTKGTVCIERRGNQTRKIMIR